LRTPLVEPESSPPAELESELFGCTAAAQVRTSKLMARLTPLVIS
jgi:hypothetical protein